MVTGGGAQVSPSGWARPLRAPVSEMGRFRSVLRRKVHRHLDHDHRPGSLGPGNRWCSRRAEWGRVLGEKRVAVVSHPRPFPPAYCFIAVACKTAPAGKVAIKWAAAPLLTSTKA